MPPPGGSPSVARLPGTAASSASTQPQPQAVSAVPQPKEIATLKELNTTVSVTSLKSIALKKQLSGKEKVAIDPSTLPREVFSETQLSVVWHDYIEMIAAKGEKIQASNLGISNPVLDGNGTTIQLTVPNQTIKTEIYREETALLAYLHDKLQNYDVKIEVNVDEKSENFKKYVVLSPQEKYQILLQENKLLDVLRSKLELRFSGS
ncbi:MAG: DNA polymerase III subunit gamma/tau [Capnocytophaga sp.]|nr:DNA polymerase III subunit gamma/tau [Capnocytophaga sp.]